jgi:predicted NBD/HSP70 family sugar kinase
MIVAVDTGGTKTLVAVFDTEGRIVAEQKFPTPKDIDQYLNELRRTVDELTLGQEITCLSVALPGTIVDGTMVWAANLGWRDTDMAALLEDHYTCPIVVENDANLAGLAEARSLADTPGVCLYLTVSTGIGTGVIIDGKIHPRLSRVEGGRIMLKRDQAYEVWELFASGQAIQHTYGKLASEITDEATWDLISANLAQGLLALLPFLQPDIVVIGGGVGTHFDRFGHKVTQILQDNLVDVYVPRLVEAAHPEEAVVYGCYYHALDSLAD